jgi:hypothetical protein
MVITPFLTLQPLALLLGVLLPQAAVLVVLAVQPLAYLAVRAVGVSGVQVLLQLALAVAFLDKETLAV